MIEIFTSLLTGATLGVHAAGFFSDMSRPADVAHLFIAIDIAAFVELNSFKDRLDGLVTEMRELPLAPGFDRVTLPGEIEQECLQERQANGIPLDPAVLADLRQLSTETGVALAP